MSATDRELWAARVQCALGELAKMEITEADQQIVADQQTLHEMVAARFASRFDEQARLYEREKPCWQNRVDDAVKRLADEGVVEQRPTGPKEANGSTLRLTESGKQGVDDACRHAFEEEERALPTASGGGGSNLDPFVAGVLTAALREKFLDNPDSHPPQSRSSRWPIMIELNLRYHSGPAEAMKRVQHLWRFVGGVDEPLRLADEYAVGELTTGQLEGLVSADAAAGDWANRAIYRIWPDFEAHRQVDVSSTTIKAKRLNEPSTVSVTESFGQWWIPAFRRTTRTSRSTKRLPISR